MKKEDEMMSAAEFFGLEEEGCHPVAKPRKRAKKNRRKATFADIKARMVMRIYGVSRAAAEKIIALQARKETAPSHEESTATEGTNAIFLDGPDVVADEIKFIGRR